jgi:hypothetical protein
MITMPSTMANATIKTPSSTLIKGLKILFTVLGAISHSRLFQNEGELSSPRTALCPLGQDRLNHIWDHPVGTAVRPTTPIP